MAADLSRVFADGLLDGQVAIVTGGGTNLGKAAAGTIAAMPEPLRRELRDLGLL